MKPLGDQAFGGAEQPGQQKKSPYGGSHHSRCRGRMETKPDWNSERSHVTEHGGKNSREDRNHDHCTPTNPGSRQQSNVRVEKANS